MILPYRVDTQTERLPWANFLIIGVCTCIHMAFFLRWFPESAFLMMVLHGWDPRGLLGSMFLHANLFHLAGNMIFLAVFGSALCSRLGNNRYLLLYVAGGVGAGVAHLLIDGRPAVGASGAIAAVCGACAMVMPAAEVEFMYAVRFHVGTFRVPVILVLIGLALLDIAAICLGTSHIAHWAHLGGFAAGIVLGLAFLKFGFHPANRDAEETVIDLLRGPRPYRKPAAAGQLTHRVPRPALRPRSRAYHPLAHR